jgi:hypothetical protein
MQKEKQEQKEQWDFGSPEEIQKALERNKKLAESGFDIRAADENEPKPIVENSVVDSRKFSIPEFEEMISSPDIKMDYEERYWAMFNIVKDLVEEIKFLKNQQGRK